MPSNLAEFCGTNWLLDHSRSRGLGRSRVEGSSWEASRLGQEVDKALVARQWRHGRDRPEAVELEIQSTGHAILHQAIIG